jgi:predicted nucleotidyltransferase
MNTYGVKPESFRLMMESFRKYPQIREVVLFGSRAKGTYHTGSDIDLAIKGDRPMPDVALDLQTMLNEELPIPYMVDVVDYHSLSHQNLIDHIDRVGIRIYQQLENL